VVAAIPPRPRSLSFVSTSPEASPALFPATPERRSAPTGPRSRSQFPWNTSGLFMRWSPRWPRGEVPSSFPPLFRRGCRGGVGGLDLDQGTCTSRQQLPGVVKCIVSPHLYARVQVHDLRVPEQGCSGALPGSSITPWWQAGRARAQGAGTRPVGCGRRRCGCRASRGRRRDSRRRCVLRPWRR
jgi:hypothetical protein